MNKISVNLLRPRDIQFLKRLINVSSVNNLYPKELENSVSIQDDSFAVNTFCGRIEQSQVFPYPKILKETEKENLKDILESLSDLFKNVDPAINDAQERIAQGDMEQLWNMNLFGATIPKEFGGLGFDHVHYAKVLEYIGSKDLNIAMALRAHQTLGVKPIVRFGSEEQQSKYLPKLAKKSFASFCLTEKSNTADPTKIISTAVVSEDGQRYILNGSKMYVDQGDLADILIVFALVHDPKSDSPLENLTAFIVQRGYEGVTVGKPEKRMGLRGVHSVEVTFKNVEIPAENVIRGVGKGFTVATKVFNEGRYSMAAILTGCMKTCIKKAVRYAANRKQFGLYMDTLGTIQEKIARMSICHYITESMTYLVAHNLDSGIGTNQVEGAMLKVFASEAAEFVCDEAMQIMGGVGCLTKTGLERLSRDLRLFRILEGTNEVQRLFIALNGLKFANYCSNHEKMELKKSLTDRIKKLGALRGHPSKFLQKKVHPELVKSSVRLGDSVDLFGKAVQLAIAKYGSIISREDFVLNRIADSAIHLYASAVALSRASKALTEDISSARQEELMTEAFILDTKNGVKQAFKNITSGRNLENFDKMKRISHNVSFLGGPVQHHPSELY